MAEAIPGGLNIPSYLRNALSNAQTGIQSTLTDVSDVMASLATSSANEQTATMEGARAGSEAAKLTAARKLQKESDNKAATAEIGTNREASSYIIAAMSHDIISAQQELRQRSKAVQEKIDTKFLDDPVGYIGNQFTIPGDLLSLQVKEEQWKRDHAVMQALLATSKDIVALNNAIDSGTSLEIAAALEKQNLAAAQASVAEQQIKLGKMNLEGANIRRAGTMEQAQLVIAAQAADATQQRLQLERSAGARAERSLQLQEEMKGYALEERLARKEEREQKVEVRAIVQNKLINLAKLTGSNPMTVLEFEKLSPQKRAELETLMSDPDIEEQRLGYNTAVAVSRADTFNFPLNPGMNYVRDKLHAVTATAPASIPADKTPWEKLKPAEQLAVTQALLQKKVIDERRNVPYEGGIYSPPSLSATLSIPLVSQMALAKELAPIAAVDKTAPTSADVILQAAVDKVKRGEASPAQMAAEFTAMYQLIAADNNTQRAYKRFVLPPIINNYSTGVHINPSFRGKPEIVNTLDAGQIENAIWRKAVAQGLGKPQQAAGSGGVPQ